MNKQPVTPTTLRYWLIAYVSELTNVRPDRVDPRRSLRQFGVDRRLVAELAVRLETLLGRRVLPSTIMCHDTLGALSERLAGAPRRLPVTVESLDELVMSVTMDACAAHC